MQSSEIHLSSRPDGVPVAENFELVTVDLPEPDDGQVLIRNLWMSVDPYMRSRMYDRDSYTQPFALGRALNGDAIGEVVASRHADFRTGDLLHHMNGWREYKLSDGRGLSKLPDVDAPSELFLGVLGMPGMTAYYGLLEVGALQPGETAFISAAAGAVGSVACQLAKLKDCRVIGSCGSDDKASWLQDELGVDATINYKTAGDLSQALAQAAPGGVDVYFENVGGAHLEAALANMNLNGRIAVCGMIQDYNQLEQAAGIHNLVQLIVQRVRMQGFLVGDFNGREAAAKQMAAWYGEGKLKSNSTVYHGIERAPEAFIGLFEGKNTGKMLVKLN